MRLIEKMYSFAKEQMKLDWNEVPGSKSNPLILETYKCVDDIGNHPEALDDSLISWCSCFMNYVCQKSGGRGTRSAAARSWALWGNETKDPKEGDIVVFKRPPSAWKGHVAFFVKKDGLFITCMGGNQDNRLCIEKVRISKLLCFRTSKD